MSKVDLEIVLDGGDTLVAGSEVAGFVGVTVNKACRCRKLTVHLEWFTHGRGNRDRKEVASVEVFAGQLTEGDRSLHPFALTVPNGPFSYEGHNLNVAWQIRANVDVPLAFDPNIKRPVRVVPGVGLLLPVDHGPRAARSGTATARRVGKFISAVMGALAFVFVGVSFLVCMGAVFVTQALADPEPSNVLGAVISVFVPSIFILIGLGFLFKAVRAAATRTRLSELDFTVPETAFVGEAMDVELSFRPRGVAGVQQVDLWLECQEVVTSGSGTNRRVSRSLVRKIPAAGLEPGALQQGASVRASREIPLPADAAISFGSNNNQLSWQAVLEVVFVDGRKVEERRPFLVAPPR